jgi:hypothetical protein
MKKILFGLTALALASATSASADKVGGYLLGAQYTQERSDGSAIRYGVGVPGLSVFGGFGAGVSLSGDVSYLRPLNTTASPAQAVVNAVPQVNAYDLYYGGSLGLSAAIGGGSGVVAGGIGITPSALIGVEFNLTNPFSVFLEGSLGYTLSIGGSNVSGGGIGGGFAPGIRLGVNYKLN